MEQIVCMVAPHLLFFITLVIVLIVFLFRLFLYYAAFYCLRLTLRWKPTSSVISLA